MKKTTTIIIAVLAIVLLVNIYARVTRVLPESFTIEFKGNSILKGETTRDWTAKGVFMDNVLVSGVQNHYVKGENATMRYIFSYECVTSASWVCTIDQCCTQEPNESEQTCHVDRCPITKQTRSDVFTKFTRKDIIENIKNGTFKLMGENDFCARSDICYKIS
jgi:hypothetical protein